MDSGRIVDISVGVAQAVLGVYLSWQAFIVSIKDLPVNEERKQKAIFAVCCLGVVFLSGIQTWHGIGSDQVLSQIESNTSHPQPAPVVNVTPVVNVPPMPQHSHVDIPIPTQIVGYPMVPFHAGEDIRAAMFIYNGGLYPLHAGLLGAELRLVEIKQLDQAFKKYRAFLKLNMSGGGTIYPNGLDNYRFTGIGPITLSAADVQDLTTNHTKVICAMGTVRWSDQTGQYGTDMYHCLIEGADGIFGWHVMQDNNAEYTLSPQSAPK